MIIMEVREYMLKPLIISGELRTTIENQILVGHKSILNVGGDTESKIVDLGDIPNRTSSKTLLTLRSEDGIQNLDLVFHYMFNEDALLNVDFQIKNSIGIYNENEITTSQGNNRVNSVSMAYSRPRSNMEVEITVTPHDLLANMHSPLMLIISHNGRNHEYLSKLDLM